MLWEIQTIKRPTSAAVFSAGLFIILFLLNPALALCYQDKESDWRATVRETSLNIYSEASTTSKVTHSLKKGDVVFIELEIVSMEGTWCGVRDAEQSKFLGYAQGAYLEREPTAQLMAWQFLPPPPPPEELAAEAEVEAKTKIEPLARSSRRVWIPIHKAEVKVELDKIFYSKFGRLLPISAYGQTRLHTSMNFDHRNSFDVPVHPDSSEGRAILAYLRNRGLPFIAFRSAVRGSATGPHIHVGNPSPRIY